MIVRDATASHVVIGRPATKCPCIVCQWVGQYAGAGAGAGGCGLAETENQREFTQKPISETASHTEILTLPSEKVFGTFGRDTTYAPPSTAPYP